MSQQLALSSLFSVLALASLSIAAGSGLIGPDTATITAVSTFELQAELAPGLQG